MKTLIFGKRSYLSKELNKKIKNSSIYSLENFSYNKLNMVYRTIQYKFLAQGDFVYILLRVERFYFDNK